MSKYINDYDSVAAYEADAAAREGLKASTMSKVVNEIKYDGVNVETTAPVMGDAVYHDADKKVKFIKGKTLNRALLPAGYVPIGVCGPMKDATRMYIVAGVESYKRFTTFYRWKVTGWNLDGMPHECSITGHGSAAIGTFTYTATTIEECAAQLDAALRANKPEKKYIAYLEEGIVIAQCCNYNDWKDYVLSISSLSVDYDTATVLPIIPNADRLCGSRGYPVWNRHRALTYYKDDNSNGSYNPTSVIHSVPAYPTCLPAYLGTSAHRDGDKCAYLRERFGEGREGWEYYMSQIMAINPYPKNMMADDDGLKATKAMAGTMLPDAEGGTTAQYPAAEYVASIGFTGVKGLEPGDWFGPTFKEWVDVAQHWTYGTDHASTVEDVMNDTLLAMGMSRHACATDSWVFSRSGVSHAWDAYSGGSVGGSYFCLSIRCVPFGLYELGSE